MAAHGNRALAVVGTTVALFLAGGDNAATMPANVTVGQGALPPCDLACRRRDRWRRVVRPTRGVLMRIAACESGHDWNAIGGGGAYRGGLQFDWRTWATVGGHGDPADASRLEQLYRGALLYRRRGAQPWPVCGYA